jgi:hypothetical protein
MKVSIKLSILLLVLISSCKKKADPPVNEAAKYSNILILGNSITMAPENRGIGWNANWGMAASKPELDFVHLLTAKFQEVNPASKVLAKNISLFEVDYHHYDMENELSTYLKEKTDLVIIRIGENVSKEPIGFEPRYRSLIELLKLNNPNVRIIAVGSFWGNDPVDEIMSRGSEFITLKTLGTDMSNYAWGLHESHDVASHPGDKGMMAIANAIWEAISLPEA